MEVEFVFVNSYNKHLQVYICIKVNHAIYVLYVVTLQKIINCDIKVINLKLASNKSLLVLFIVERSFDVQDRHPSQTNSG